MRWEERQGVPKGVEHLQGEKDGAIIPFAFPSPFWLRPADSTTRKSLAASQWGRCWRSDCHPPRNPSPPLPTCPKVHPRQVGRGRQCPTTSAAYASGSDRAPIHTLARGHRRPVHPHCTSGHSEGAGGLAPGCNPDEEGWRDQAAGARPEVLSDPGSRTLSAAGHAAKGAPGRGKLLLNGASRPAAPRCGNGGQGRERVCAPTRPDFRTAARRERRSGSPSPRTSPASARRAHTGAHAPAHSHALHTHSVSGPTPVPGNRKLPAPRAGPTQFTRPQSPSGAWEPVHRGHGTLGPPRRPSQKLVRPGFPSTAGIVHPAQTRGGEEGAAPRLGLALGIGDWGKPATPPITP